MALISSPEKAQRIYDILVEECGAPETERQQFCAYHNDALHTEPASEWRFRGSLGSGGKFITNHGLHYVFCYPPDETPERLAAIAKANARLKAFGT